MYSLTIHNMDAPVHSRLYAIAEREETSLNQVVKRFLHDALLIRQLKELTASERDGRRPVHLIRPRRGAVLPKRQPHLLPKQIDALALPKNRQTDFSDFAGKWSESESSTFNAKVARRIDAEDWQ